MIASFFVQGQTAHIPPPYVRKIGVFGLFGVFLAKVARYKQHHN
jgi:hypothetical protein